MTTQNPAPTCGGCEGKGAHSRACRSPIHTIADLVDNLGDTLSNHPNQANTAWNLAAQLRAIAASAGVIDREAIARAMDPAAWHDGPSTHALAVAQRLAARKITLDYADRVLTILPTRTVAQVKAEALREAAAEFDFTTIVADIWLNARADELEREDKR